MIFLQIASYRDKELNSTIQSALSKAKYPNNINFGIVEQCASNEPSNSTCTTSLTIRGDHSRCNHYICGNR